MSSPSENLAIAKRYLQALESGLSGEHLSQYFSPDVIIEIFPSRFFPNGSRSTLAEALAASERGKKAMSSQTYEIRNALAADDQVALEIDWTGTLAVAFQSIPVGGKMRAYFAAFLQFKNGKIISQRNYDCYES
jgi:ketosteroid isomerase-like protein